MWNTRAVERLGVRSMVVTDGPNGARGGGLMGTGTPTACIPAGSVLGATWDDDLIEAVGGLLGDEANAKGANVLLAPTINLHRSPLGGRNFECYSEDPLLSGRTAAAFVRGVQSRNVATTAKHFVANDSEFERNSINSVVDERTLRELYLVPFELAVKGGGAWGIMTAYNRLNGTFCAEHDWLLTDVLRSQWGFDGFVVSDWFGTRSTADSLRGGLSLEMPGRGVWFGPEKIGEALDAGELDEAHLDARVGEVLTVMERTGVLDGVGGGPEKTLDRPEDRALARKAAIGGSVLLRNNGVLPLDPGQLTSVAVIGPNARNAKIMGGGSASVRSYYRQTPLDALTERLAGSAEVKWAQGCVIDRSTPALAAPMLRGPLTVEFFNGHDWEGEVVATTTLGAAQAIFFGEPAEGVDPAAFSFRATGTFSSEDTGTHTLKLVQSGDARVSIDGTVVLDALEGEFPKGDAFFGMGTAPIPAELDLVAGEEHELLIEYRSKGAVLLTGAEVALEAPGGRDHLAEAEALAAEADVAILVVGTNDDWETEGRDRDLFVLPGDQPELIRRVCAANANTVVVMNVGGPHGVDWVDVPAAVLHVGFGGQEMANATVDMLLGDADPGGRMPYSTPVRYEHSTALPNYPGENSEVRYGEGLFMGYRGLDARRLDPAVPFGHGLSYATFQWSDLRVADSAAAHLESAVRVEVDVTNTSDRAGSEVVQMYVEPEAPRLQRPVRELKGYAKLHLDPGETATAVIDLDFRSFAFFDPADNVLDSLPPAGPVPSGGGAERRSEPGWYVQPGNYRIVAAHSVADHASSAIIELTGDEGFRAP